MTWIGEWKSLLAVVAAGLLAPGVGAAGAEERPMSYEQAVELARAIGKLPPGVTLAAHRPTALRQLTRTLGLVVVTLRCGAISGATSGPPFSGGRTALSNQISTSSPYRVHSSVSNVSVAAL